MSTFDFDEFEPYAVAEPSRDRRRDNPDPSVYCHELGKYVPPDIVECSQFSAVAALSLHQMQKIALPIDPRHGIDDRSYR